MGTDTSNNKADAIKSLYSQRDKFILIGLTGRTGSGCTTVAKILSKDNFQDLDLRSYKTCDYNNSDERKYSVIYRYMKEGKKWKKFDVIEASSIILSFILQDTYGRLFSYIDSIAMKVNIKEKEQLKKKIACVLMDENVDKNFTLDSIKNTIIDSNLRTWIDNVFNNDKHIESETKDSLLKMINYFTSSLINKKNNFCKALKDITVEEINTVMMTKNSTIYIHTSCNKWEIILEVPENMITIAKIQAMKSPSQSE